MSLRNIFCRWTCHLCWHRISACSTDAHADNALARSERCSLHAVALLDPIWIDKWHQLFPAHWKVGPAPVFWASRPLEPAEWLALLILKAGDVESIPGPQNRKLPPSSQTTQTTILN